MTPGVEVKFVCQRLGHQLQLDRRHRFGDRQPSRKVRSDDEILQLVRVRIADGRSCRGRQVEFGVVLKERQEQINIMCIRKMLKCPLCGSLKPIPELTVVMPPNVVVCVVYEVPCGFSYCGVFDSILDFVPPPFDATEVHRGCSVRCDFRLCHIDTVLQVCCDGRYQTHAYRVVSLRQHRRN